MRNELGSVIVVAAVGAVSLWALFGILRWFLVERQQFQSSIAGRSTTKGRRACALCGSLRRSHSCILEPAYRTSGGGVSGILRDPERRTPFKPGRQADSTPVWSCKHRHRGRRRVGRYGTYRRKREGMEGALRCAMRELYALQRGQGAWKYPSRPRLDPAQVRMVRDMLRYEPGIRQRMPADEWAKLILDSRGMCFYCQTEFDLPEQDHVVPIARGGSSAAWNFVVACRTCNRRKGARTGWEFLLNPTDAQRRRLEQIDSLTNRKELSRKERRRLARARQDRRADASMKAAETRRRKREEALRRQTEARREEDRRLAEEGGNTSLRKWIDQNFDQ